MAVSRKEETVQKKLPGLLLHMKGLCVVLGYVRLLPQKSNVLEQGFVLISYISGCRCSALQIICLPQLFVTNDCN